MIRIRISDIEDAAKTRPEGYADEVFAAAIVRNDEFISLPLDAYERLLEKYSGRRVVSPVTESNAPTHGPGTELKKLLAGWPFRIVASPDCSCNASARLMDENEEREPGWCASNEDLIVGWLREEATKRGLPFVDMAGRMLVRRAIRNAKLA